MINSRHFLYAKIALIVLFLVRIDHGQACNTLTWHKNGSGSFHDQDNWLALDILGCPPIPDNLRNRVPGPNDGANYSTHGGVTAYTVTFLNDVTTGVLDVNSADVAFDLNGNTYFANGLSVRDGDLRISGPGSTVHILNFRQMQIAAGSLTIEQGASLIGNQVDQISGGNGPPSMVTVRGNGSKWQGGSINIGMSSVLNPSAALRIEDGAIVTHRDAVIGRRNFNGMVEASALVTGVGSEWNLSGRLTVAESGNIGKLEIERGASVLVRDRTFVGGDFGAIGADGLVTLSDVDSLFLSPTISIGGISSTGTVILEDGTLSSININLADGSTFDFLGGRLQIDGFNGNLFQHGGTLAPGFSITPSAVSSAFIFGDYFLDSSGAVEVELKGSGSDEYDQLIIDGEVDLNADNSGGGSLDLILGFSPKLGDSFTIIDNGDTDAINGIFSGLPEGSTVDIPFRGQSFTFGITYQGGIDSNDVVLTVNEIIPEPSSSALLVVGGLIMFRRRIA